MTAALLARKSYYTEEIATVKDLLDKDVKLTPAIMEILYFSFRSKINCCRTNEEKRDVCLVSKIIETHTILLALSE
jgi:hypothetical protein